MPSTSPRSVRKQVRLTPEQDRALRQRSRELGVSEAELLRRALGDAAGRPGEAVDALVADARRLGEGRAVGAGWTRDDLYDRRATS